MPKRDGTGPMNMGSMTGRGFGICKNAFNFAAGSGLGLGCRNGYYRGVGRGLGKKNLLEEQKELLKNQLTVIDEELKNL